MAKTVIIGGVAGGASTAARLRRLDEKAEIVVFERGSHVSYANCGLPYYAGGTIQERDRLFLMTPQKFRDILDVDVRVDSEVVVIDPAAKTVTVRERGGREYVEAYDALVLSPGAEPLRPPIPGIDDPRILTVRSVPDIDRVKEVLDTARPERAVVIGGGFIGLEMAENLHERGLAVTVVEALGQVMNVVDLEIAAPVHHHLRDKGVGLFLEDAVQAFVRDEAGLRVRLASGTEIATDLVILSIGVKPDTRLAREARLELDPRGHIVVDAFLRTNLPGIFAVGDAIVARSPLTGRPMPVPLAGPANKQARLVADTIANGPRKPWKGSIATAVAKVFDLTVASTGLSEKLCVREGIPFQSLVIHPGSHAGYYPGAQSYALKLLWSPQDGRILGAQAVGRDGVDKRIDAIAAHLGMGGTVHDLAEFEHAYAPPYSGAKDGVNYAGFCAENALEGLTNPVGWNQVEAWKARGAAILDVRTPQEFELGHLDGAVNISNTELRARLAEVPRDRPVLLYCGVGLRGYLSERILRQNGHVDIGNLSGGWKTWQAVTSPQTNPGTLPSRRERNHDTMDEPAYAEGSGTPEPRPVPAAAEIRVDACGLQCPGPILKLKEAMDAAVPGSRVTVRASDAGFSRDAQAWCNITRNRLVSVAEEGGVWSAVFEKSMPALVPTGMTDPVPGLHVSGDEATVIVFSNDLDRALASFVIANGALATGKKVTMFFTFWGLSVIKRREKVKVRKDFLGRMFGMMLPGHADALKLSQMHFGGFGSWLMKKRMQAFQVDQLEAMMESARKAGVRMTACQMSMELMGVAREELMDGVEQGGVASYLEAAGSAGINLFI
jgi:NADPH-dependent 2,4-dienoyl-CoA reductase/sulfur reductase-like enzyme/peroxiredoxin family protein/rhodanese-related sulfurtransferase/TusA-related sulfurtransferase